MAGQSAGVTGPGSAIGDLGLGSNLKQQQQDETEEERKKRLLGLSSGNAMSPAVNQLFGFGGLGGSGS